MRSVRKRFEHRHNELVEIIYHTTVDPEGWRALLHRLVELLDGCSARLLFLDGTAESLNASFTANMEESSLRQYVDHYMNICPWWPELRHKRTGQLYSSYLDFSHDQAFFHHSEFYTDWARAQGIEHEMSGNVIATPDYTVQLQVQRSGESGHFSHEETAVVNILLPHMQRALELRRHLDEERRACEGIVEASLRSSLPCILLNEKLEVIHMDDNVIPLLVGYPELRIMSRKVSLTNARLNGLLQRQLKSCAAAAHGEWSHQCCVRQQGAGSDLEIHVYPIYLSRKTLYSKCGHHVALFLNDSRARYTLNEQLIHESFGLSPTELRLAEAIFNGDTLGAFANENGTTLNTVRSQVKQLFAKTGIRRQAELPKRLLPYLLLR